MDDLETYRRMLRPNKHRLDDELELQADIMSRISDRIAQLVAKVSEAENNLKVTEARLYREFKDSDDRATDKAAESAVKRHQERTRAFERVTGATQELAQWNGLHEAWRVRGYSVNKLCDLYVAQYFTKNSHSISNRSDRRRSEEEALQDRKPYHGGSEKSTSVRRLIREA
jgi:hypothetical protein